MEYQNNEIKNSDSVSENDTNRNSKIIDLSERMCPSPLEAEYIALYGEEFVEDLKAAYRWMRRDMRMQAPEEEIVKRRRNRHHNIGDWISVFYVDLRNQDFCSVCIDDQDEKTMSNYGHSPCFRTETNHNIRYLLSGMFFYDKDKTKKWLNELLGPGEKFWCEKHDFPVEGMCGTEIEILTDYENYGYRRQEKSLKGTFSLHK